MSGRPTADTITDDQLDALYEQLDRAERRVADWQTAYRSALGARERVEALHVNDFGLCRECTGSHGVPWPCPTIRAITGQETT